MLLPKKTIRTDMKFLEVKFLKWFIVGELMNQMDVYTRDVRSSCRI
jgi:hypothetical protein